MALKHIARYRAMVTGHTVEEEMAVIKAREKGSYQKLFGVKDEFRREKILGGRNDERRR